MSRILITNEEIDPKDCVYGLPWKYDATCFNFKDPNKVVKVSDLHKINCKKVETLVIGCDLDDYSFIADMENLRQLYIYTANNIRDISFIKPLTKLWQLYIGESHLESLDALRELVIEQKRLREEETDGVKRLGMTIDAIYIESDRELDGNVLLTSGVYISELIVNGKWVRS